MHHILNNIIIKILYDILISVVSELIVSAIKSFIKWILYHNKNKG